MSSPDSSRRKGVSVQALAVDAASYVYAAWISGGTLNKQISYFDIQVDLGTSTTLAWEMATGAAGTGVFGTTTLYGSASFTAGQLIGLTTLAEASIYYNIKPAATTTFRSLIINERFDW